MEELVDISQDRGPLLFCCCTVAAPLPTLTGLEYYSPKPLFSLVFLFFSVPSPNSNPSSLLPLLKTAPQPLPPLLSPSRTISLALSLCAHPFRWLRAERGALRRRVFGKPATRRCCFLQKEGGKKQMSGAAFPFASTPSHSRVLPLSLSVIPCLSDDFSH